MLIFIVCKVCWAVGLWTPATPTRGIGSILGSNLTIKKRDEILLSDTESMKLFLVRDQEVGDSSPWSRPCE